jgi:CubicO group peptidase (beta-lactamase class C family)
MKNAILNKMERLISSKKLNYFTLVLYDGKQWHTRELHAVSPCQNCHSVTKTFTATAIGIAQDMNLLSVEDTIDQFFINEWSSNYDPELKNVKIRHLLTHTMGIEKGFLFEADRLKINTDNWLHYCLSKPLRNKPGEAYMYSNSTFYLLSCIISRASSMTLERFLYKHLFKPLSITNYAWGSCPSGETQGATNLFMSTKDMAKLGVLYLNKGIWENNRILSDNWVNEATKIQTPDSSGIKYGFGMFITDTGYQFVGIHNQYVTIQPNLNMVAAAHGFVQNMDINAILKSVIS